MRRIATALTGVAVLTMLAGCSCTEQDCDPTGGELFGAICDARAATISGLGRETQQATLLQRKTQLEQEEQRLQAEQKSPPATWRPNRPNTRFNDFAAVRKMTGSQAENRALKEQATALARQVTQSQQDITDLTLAETRRAARIAELSRSSRSCKGVRGRDGTLELTTAAAAALHSAM
jgi:hypothetical protein